MKHLSSLIFCCCLFLAAPFIQLPVGAQRGSVTLLELPTKRQLPMGNLHAVYRDREGYMWYCTEENLCRDNGYQVDVFCSDAQHPGLLSSNNVRDVAEDLSHHIWIATANGLHILDKSNYRIHGVRCRGCSGVSCDALLALDDGSVWVATPRKAYHFGAGECVLDSVDLSQWQGGISSFYEDSRHTLWALVRNGGVMRFSDRKRSFVSSSWDSRYKPLRMVEDEAHGCYWVSTWGDGLCRYVPSAIGDGAVIEPQSASSSLNTNQAKVIDLLLDTTSPMLWATTMDGLYAYDIVANGGSYSLRSHSTVGLLPKGKNIVNRMTIDPWGNIWVASYSPQTFILSHSVGGYTSRAYLSSI